MTKMRHNNRNTNKRNTKVAQGTQQIIEDNLSSSEDFDTSWFKPSEGQAEAMKAIDKEDVDVVILTGPAGTGKSTAAVAKALTELKKGHFKQIVFCKNPAEYGDDQIGFLVGSSDQKLEKHLEVMRGIFLDFMSPVKLKAEEGRGRIKFTIPNFIAGATLYETCFILDESQTFTPNTLKLLLERAGEGTKIFVLGDSKQTYAVKKRADGLADLLGKVLEEGVSKEELFHYVKLTSNDNKRSRLSKRVTELYD